jgi:hypothetical protein
MISTMSLLSATLRILSSAIRDMGSKSEGWRLKAEEKSVQGTAKDMDAGLDSVPEMSV